jgi:hypothetical protein
MGKEKEKIEGKIGLNSFPTLYPQFQIHLLPTLIFILKNLSLSYPIISNLLPSQHHQIIIPKNNRNNKGN